MADPFAEIAPLYANIISEAKARIRIIDQVLTQPLFETLGHVAVSDLCALQFRKVFESIALGCLVVHGDLPGTKRLKDDTYRADKLLRSLERLNPEFYPKPCTVVWPNEKTMQIDNVKDVWLTKERLRKLYFLFDHEMHVGSLARRSSVASAFSRQSLENIALETRALISTHWIFLLDGRRVLCDAEKDHGKIQIRVLTPE